ncbi:hypothetical protein D3C71_1089080 [compost metagenome]
MAGGLRGFIAGACIDLGRRLHENGETGVHLVHLGLADFYWLIADLRQNQLVQPGAFVFCVRIRAMPQQNAAASILAQQNDGHQLLGQSLGGALDHSRGQPGIAQAAHGQRRREQADFRQSGGQRLR